MLAHLVLASALASSPATVARVGDEAIALDEVAERRAIARARREPATAEQIADQLVAQALLAIDARRTGLSEDADVRRSVERERRRALVDRLLERELAVAITDDELRRLFHELSDTVDIDAVVLVTEREAREAAARLGRGGALADEAGRSLDPEGKRRGGALGERTRSQLEPALAAAAFAAPIGSFQGPVKLKLGHAVFRVRARRVAEEAGFAGERQSLRKFAEEQARGHVRTRHLAGLRVKAGVKVDERFLLSAPGEEAPPAAMEHVVATVGTTALRYREVVAEMRRLAAAGAGGHAASGRARVDLAWALVDKLLLEQEAARTLAADPVARSRAQAAERAVLADAWVERARQKLAPPDGAATEAFYRAHRSDYTVARSRRCSQIVTSSREAAEAILKRLSAGEAFDDLARRFSLDPATRSSGGLIGDVTDARLDALRSTEPQVVAAVHGARPGKVTAPARSAGGWHLFRCEKPTAARVRPLAEVKDEIVRRLEGERLEQAIAARVRDLRRDIPVHMEQEPLHRIERNP